jgi:nucleotide-binding universal stress UspA family protein
VDRFFAGMDVAITAVNVARNPMDTVPPVPFGGAFPWGLPWGPAGPDMAAGDRTAWEQAVVREQQAGEAVALAQAPADADVEVVFGEVVEAILRAADDEDADLIVVGSNDKGFLQRLLGGSVSEELARKATAAGADRSLVGVLQLDCRAGQRRRRPASSVRIFGREGQHGDGPFRRRTVPSAAWGPVLQSRLRGGERRSPRSPVGDRFASQTGSFVRPAGRPGMIRTSSRWCAGNAAASRVDVLGRCLSAYPAASSNVLNRTISSADA